MVKVIPFEAALGAEVQCGRLQDVIEATASAIRAASLQHQVVLIRGQRLSNADLVAFGRLFGEFQSSNPLGSPLALEGKVEQGGVGTDRRPAGGADGARHGQAVRGHRRGQPR